ncbi:hypothetical protein MHYP_G00343930 [Metynnis hypsauchen]
MKTGIATATVRIVSYTRTLDQAFLRAPRQPAGRLATEGRLAASSTLRQPKEKPEAAESYSTPPFDHRLFIGRPPSSQASLPGRQETEVGYQLRRLACLKPHQDIWDRPWKPQREPTGSQARFPSLGFQVRFLDLKKGVTTIDPAELDHITSALQNQGAVIGRHAQLLHDMIQQLTLVRAQTDGAQPASASAGTGVGAGASAAAPVLASPLPPTDPTPIRGDALVANPERYTGDPETCRGFLLQCSLVFEPSRLPTERSKVAYMISLLTGRALAWATSLWERTLPQGRAS